MRTSLGFIMRVGKRNYKLMLVVSVETCLNNICSEAYAKRVFPLQGYSF